MSEQSFDDRAREIMSRLQGVVADDLLSWKPGPCIKTKDGVVGMFFPYIDANVLAERLDTVLGAWNWSVAYSTTESDKPVTVCELTVSLMDECIIKREGVGNFDSSDEGHAEHGSRTKAFRDACRALGVCGRDIDGTQTKFIPVDANEREDNGKLKFTNVKPKAPLTRADLINPGRHAGATGSGLAQVRSSVEHNNATRSPEKAAELTDKDITPADVDNILWESGKYKGKPLTELPSHFIDWAFGNMDTLKPDSPKFKKKLYDALVIAVDVKAKRKAEKEPAGVTPAQAADLLDGVLSSEDEIPF